MRKVDDDEGALVDEAGGGGALTVVGEIGLAAIAAS